MRTQKIVCKNNGVPRIMQELLPLCMVRFFLFFLGLLGAIGITSSGAFAEWNMGNILLKHNYQHFSVSVGENGFIGDTNTPKQGTSDFCLAQESVATNAPAPTPSGTKAVQSSKIADYLIQKIAPQINKDPTAVTISKNAEGKIVFDGYGQFGEKLNIELSSRLIEKAIQENITVVTLVIDRISPPVTVTDPDLKTQGITELIAIGQSNFTGSSSNRRFNLTLAASHFNGLLIPKDSQFSFNGALGHVGFDTGYKSSPVIMGDSVEDGVGGGVCQVSTTAFRGAMLAGVDILERWNHRFAMKMYFPYGTDATVYEGGKDLKFVNNTPGAILLQTRVEGDELYFYYYGTRDSRTVKILGPYKYATVGAPSAPVIKDTPTLPVGKEKVERASIAGFKTAYSRVVTFLNRAEPENKQFGSHYVAEPKLILRGASPTPSGSPAPAPAGNATGEVPRGQ